MRLSELNGREDALAVLAATLAEGWTAQFGRPVRVETVFSPGAQAWRLQPLLSVLVTGRASSTVRRFAADTFRYTPQSWRKVPQWLLGTALASSPGLRLSARPIMWASPPVRDAENLLVLPGNRRVRVFDFGASRCRVMLKPGYDPLAMRAELRVRCSGDGPFPKVTAWDPEGRWLEEPIIDGFALPRCPPWRNRASLEQEAHHLLARHLAATARPVEAAARVAALVTELEESVPRLDRQLGTDMATRLTPVLPVLARVASTLGPIRLAEAHGDYQPGNVLVERTTGRVLLSDWEHSAQRFDHYDALVWGLQARRATGLQGRVASFLADGTIRGVAALLPEGKDAAWRRGAFALFLLEDLLWMAHDGLSGPRAGVSPASAAILRIAEAFSPAEDAHT